MSVMVTEYCKYGDINNFIAKHSDKERFLKYRERWKNNKDDLLFLVLETISRCNLKCTMCAYSSGYSRAQPMDDDIFEIVEENIKQMNIPSLSMNQLNEPLLDSKIFKRIKRIVEIDSVLDIHMNTNAMLLDRQNSIKILESGLTRLLIGFDAFTKETYEKVRCGANYEKVMDNIMNFLRLKEETGKKLPVVRISLVKTSINEHEIEKWFEFWKHKVDYVSIQEYLTHTLDESKNHLIASRSGRKAVNTSTITCIQPFERAIIRGDGDVLPCCAPFAVNMPLGNIKRNSLKDIWYGENAKKLRLYFIENRWHEHQICSGCLRISYGLTAARNSA